MDKQLEKEQDSTQLDRYSKALLDELNAFAGDANTTNVDITAFREGSKFIWKKYGGENTPCVTRDIQIGDHIPARLYLRCDNEHGENSPIVVFFHGGGWSVGDIESYDGLMSDLANAGDWLVINVDYRLAPEHKFPAGLNDCLAAVRWIQQSAESHGGDPSRMVLMGDSAGGNLAMVVTNILHREHRTSPKGLCLLYPVLDLQSPHSAYPSRQLYGNGEYLISRQGFDLSKSWYLEKSEQALDPRVSPLFSDDLDLLPPTVIVTAGFDPLVDEGRLLAEKLEATGHQVTYRCYETTMHGFLSFGILPVCLEGRRYLAEQIGRLLSE